MSDTPEQAARDMLERMGVEDAQSFTAGDVVELPRCPHCNQARRGLAETLLKGAGSRPHGR